jgi:hypothetical protein
VTLGIEPQALNSDVITPRTDLSRDVITPRTDLSRDVTTPVIISGMCNPLIPLVAKGINILNILLIRVAD